MEPAMKKKFSDKAIWYKSVDLAEKAFISQSLMV